MKLSEINKQYDLELEITDEYDRVVESYYEWLDYERPDLADTVIESYEIDYTSYDEVDNILYSTVNVILEDGRNITFDTSFWIIG